MAKGCKRRRRQILITLVFAALAWTIHAPAPAAARELKIGVTQFPSTLNPNIDSMLAKNYVLAMTRRPLTTYDQSWSLVCMLCTEIPTMENGRAKPEALADGSRGLAVTYTIQDGATWGDGTAVSTDDVVFTWRVGKHPQSGVANSELYRRILSIDAIDAKTFTLHMDRITFDFAAINDFEVLPAHIERPIFEADPGQYRNRTTYDSDPTNKGLYFGPYRITELVSGATITLAPNPTWWGKTPAFERIVVRTISNTAALEANLLSGAIDMIAGELGLTIDQALAFEKRHGRRFNIFYKPGLIYEHIEPNLDNPILADIRVRRALVHALDREAINKRLFDGRQPVARASVSPLDWVYQPDVRRYPFDPGKAAALLDQAGWPVLKDGFRHNAAGERLSLEIMTTAGNRTRELVEQVLQSQWREAGIDVRIRNEPARVFFGETVAKRKFPAMAMFAWSSSPENVPRTTLYSTQIPSAANNWAGQNVSGYVSARMDALIDAIEIELDRDKRKALWDQLQRLYAEDLPAIPLYWRATPYILPKWLKGLRPTGHQGTTTLWIEDWTAEDN